MNTAIDVIATFNTVGDIKPNFIRIEDDRHEMKTYGISNINNMKTEKYSGINSFLYNCNIQVNDNIQEVNIRYYVNSHKWVMIN